MTGSAYDDEIIHVGFGYRTVVAGDGNDTIMADEAGFDDAVVASGYYSGGNGDDTIEAGAGDDVLIGGTGRDSMWGGAGADFIRAEADDGAPTSGSGSYGTISGGAGHDAIVIGGFFLATTVKASGDEGNDYIVLGDEITLDYSYHAGDGYDMIVREGAGSIETITVFDVEQEYCSIIFSLQDYDFSRFENDQTWEVYTGQSTNGFDFEITADDLDSDLISAYADYSASRSGEPPLSAGLWFV